MECMAFGCFFFVLLVGHAATQQVFLRAIVGDSARTHISSATSQTALARLLLRAGGKQ